MKGSEVLTLPRRRLGIRSVRFWEIAVPASLGPSRRLVSPLNKDMGLLRGATQIIGEYWFHPEVELEARDIRGVLLSNKHAHTMLVDITTSRGSASLTHSCKKVRLLEARLPYGYLQPHCACPSTSISYPSVGAMISPDSSASSKDSSAGLSIAIGPGARVATGAPVVVVGNVSGFRSAVAVKSTLA